MTTLRWPSLFVLYATVAFLAFHGMAGDRLLFGNDPLSLAVYSSTAILAVALALGIISLPLLACSQVRRDRIYRAAGLVGTAAIVAAFPSTILDQAVHALRIGPLIRAVDHTLGSIGLLSAALVFGWLVVWRGPDQAGLVKRTMVLASTLLFVLCAFATLWWTSVREVVAKHQSDDDSGQHVALLVLDGFAARLLPAYDAAASQTTLDNYLDDGLVFTNVHSTAPHTNGWFGILYGNAIGPGLRRTRVIDEGRNLLGSLQGNGVATRWIVYHQNGIPEASGAHVSQYRGLRSVFLTEHYRWVPRWLGLDYHFKMNTEKFARRSVRGLMRPIYRLLNDRPVSKNVFVDLLLPELRELRSRANRSFVIFHTRTPSQEPQVGAQVFHEDPDDPLTAIRKNDNRYDPTRPDHIRLAAEEQEKLAKEAAVLTSAIADFLSLLRKDPMLRDTVVLLTADHGTMFARGRFWYGFHPDEEVLHVPFIALNVGKRGRDDRLFSTPDIAATILDLLSIPSTLHDSALSMFGDRQHEFTASLTRQSDRHRERFLVVYKDGVKHRFNIHGEGDLRWAAINPASYGERVREQSPTIPRTLVPLLAAGMADVGITRDLADFVH